MAKALVDVKNKRKRTVHFLAFLLTALTVGMPLTMRPAAAQTETQSVSERKVITRVEPEYPEALKRLFIGGVVRVEAVVAANGTVEKTELLGGNPILGQSAMKAIKRWKYAPAGAREKLIVTLTFDPHR